MHEKLREIVLLGVAVGMRRFETHDGRRPSIMAPLVNASDVIEEGQTLPIDFCSLGLPFYWHGRRSIARSRGVGRQSSRQRRRLHVKIFTAVGGLKHPRFIARRNAGIPSPRHRNWNPNIAA
jgi:hypothetical protein